MAPFPTFLTRLLARATNNLAATALLFAPIVVIVGLLTDRPRGTGLDARGGVEASLPSLRDLRPTI
jgi:hypothetical protein